MVGDKLAGDQVAEDLAAVVVKVVEKQEGQQRTLQNEEGGVKMEEWRGQQLQLHPQTEVEVVGEGVKGQQRRIQNEKAMLWWWRYLFERKHTRSMRMTGCQDCTMHA